MFDGATFFQINKNPGNFSSNLMSQIHEMFSFINLESIVKVFKNVINVDFRPYKLLEGDGKKIDKNPLETFKGVSGEAAGFSTKRLRSASLSLYPLK